MQYYIAPEYEQAKAHGPNSILIATQRVSLTKRAKSAGLLQGPVPNNNNTPGMQKQVICKDPGYRLIQRTVKKPKPRPTTALPITTSTPKLLHSPKPSSAHSLRRATPTRPSLVKACKGADVSPASSSSSVRGLAQSGDGRKEQNTDDGGKKAVWPSLVDVQRLKIGGFRYKNIPRLKIIPKYEYRQKENEEPCNKPMSLETKKKTIKNLGTIIVPSHTCEECPLCSLYYSKDDLWPDHPTTPRVQNNHNNCVNKIKIRKSQCCRRSTAFQEGCDLDDSDLKKAAKDIAETEYSVPNTPRTTPEPVLDDNIVCRSDAKTVERQNKTDEKTGTGNALLPRRLKTGPPSANIIQSRLRNPFKDFRNEGVSVTVRIPVNKKDEVQNDGVIGGLRKPVTFKFSYVKVNRSDIEKAMKGQARGTESVNL